MDSMMKGKKSNHASKTAAMAIMFMLVIPFSASAAGDAYIDSLWTGATAAYAEGRWEDAIDGYTAISRSGLESADLYCNIGSAYFKAEDYPHAVLYYERALKLDPSCSDARYNLEVVSGFIQDRLLQRHSLPASCRGVRQFLALAAQRLYEGRQGSGHASCDISQEFSFG